MSSGVTSSKSMRTGMRCCTLTKLPAELSVGTREYFEPVASEMAVTCPRNVLPGDAVHLDTHLLSDIDVGDLRLAVVCRDPLVHLSDEVGKSLSGRDVLARFQRAPAHVPVIGGCHHSVGEIQVGQVKCRFGPQDGRVDIDLSSAGFRILRAGLRLSVGAGRYSVLGPRRNPLWPGHTVVPHRFLPQQPFVAVEVLFSFPESCFRFFQAGRLFCDVCFGGLYVRVQHALRALRVHQCRFSLFLPYQVFSVVEHDERIAFVDELMFTETYVLDIAGHADIYRRYVLVDGCVVL